MHLVEEQEANTGVAGVVETLETVEGGDESSVTCCGLGCVVLRALVIDIDWVIELDVDGLGLVIVDEVIDGETPMGIGVIVFADPLDGCVVDRIKFVVVVVTGLELVVIVEVVGATAAVDENVLLVTKSEQYELFS